MLSALRPLVPMFYTENIRFVLWKVPKWLANNGVQLDLSANSGHISHISFLGIHPLPLPDQSVTSWASLGCNCHSDLGLLLPGKESASSPLSAACTLPPLLAFLSCCEAPSGLI